MTQNFGTRPARCTRRYCPSPHPNRGLFKPALSRGTYRKRVNVLHGTTRTATHRLS
jgi:hypothetical protein